MECFVGVNKVGRISIDWLAGTVGIGCTNMECLVGRQGAGYSNIDDLHGVHACGQCSSHLQVRGEAARGRCEAQLRGEG